MECSEISSPIIRTYENPLQTHNFVPAGFHKKLAKFHGDVTLVFLNELDVRKPLVASTSQTSEELRLYDLV
jgi:hypothetical protein